MRAQQLRLDVPDPGPGPGELVLDVAACAVCRTDLRLCEGDLEARRLPLVPGHQAVGRVAAASAGGYHEPPPSALDAAVTFAPAGRWASHGRTPRSSSTSRPRSRSAPWSTRTAG